VFIPRDQSLGQRSTAHAAEHGPQYAKFRENARWNSWRGALRHSSTWLSNNNLGRTRRMGRGICRAARRNVSGLNKAFAEANVRPERLMIFTQANLYFETIVISVQQSMHIPRTGVLWLQAFLAALETEVLAFDKPVCSCMGIRITSLSPAAVLVRTQTLIEHFTRVETFGTLTYTGPGDCRSNDPMFTFKKRKLCRRIWSSTALQ